MRAEAKSIMEAMATLLRAGVAASDARAAEVAERHRRHLDRWFYPCDLAMHRRLARLYVDDPRFAATFDAVAEGLSAYFAGAIQAR